MPSTPHHYRDEMAALDAASRDGQPGRDARHFRRLVAARRAQDRAVTDVVVAVAEARAAGDSWTVIGAALGISRQAAQRKYGPLTKGSDNVVALR